MGSASWTLGQGDGKDKHLSTARPPGQHQRVVGQREGAWGLDGVALLAHSDPASGRMRGIERVPHRREWAMPTSVVVRGPRMNPFAVVAE